MGRGLLFGAKIKIPDNRTGELLFNIILLIYKHKLRINSPVDSLNASEYAGSHEVSTFLNSM